jgi:hypothetical protein
MGFVHRPVGVTGTPASSTSGGHAGTRLSKPEILKRKDEVWCSFGRKCTKDGPNGQVVSLVTGKVVPIVYGPGLEPKPKPVN